MINYIALTPDIATPKGNFTFLYDQAGQADIYEKCLEAEKMSKKHYNSCMNHLRSAMELTAYDLEARYRQETSGSSKTEAAIQQEIKNDVRRNRNPAGRGNFNIKTMLKNEVCRHPRNDKALIRKYKEFVTANDVLYNKKYAQTNREFNFVNLIYDLYSFFSDNSHAEGKATEEECAGLLWIFHDMLALLYHVKHIYQPYLCPIEDYFPVQKQLYKSMGFVERETPDIYVTEENGHIEYFLLKKASDDMTAAQKRELSALQHLWKRSIDSPNNILYMYETVGAGSCRYQVFAFSSQPAALTKELLNGLDDAQKEELVIGIIKSVESLHSQKPPIPHRGLNPESFYVCSTFQGIKPLLVSFDTVKDLSFEASFSMFARVADLARDRRKKIFLAPEVLLKEENQNLLKADIYSLGKLVCYIYNGLDTDTDELPAGLSERKIQLIQQMTAKDPLFRPSISQILQQFTYLDSAKPSYAVCTIKGKRRAQEDAFYCSETSEIFGNDQLLGDTVRFPLILGVFDGLGGGEDGQEMARRAAQKTSRFYQGLQHPAEQTCNPDFRRLVSEMIQEAEAYEEEEDLEDAGTTMAAAMITSDRLYFVNVGDSIIFRIHGQTVEHLSQVHRYSQGSLRKGGLYQYIGMSQEKYLIEPYIGQTSYTSEDYILLATDGFSDAVSDGEILSILHTFAPLKEKASGLVKKASENGSKDNITVILFKGV